MITRIGFQAAVNGNFEWMFWGLCPLVNNNLCTATRLSDAQGPLSSPTWKSPVFLFNELAIIARSTFIFAISSWIDIYALCILSNAKNTEYRIFNSGGGGILVCDSIESCLSIHRSAASFLSQYTGIIQEHAQTKRNARNTRQAPPL